MLSISPSYKQWDYLVVNSTFNGTTVDASTTVNIGLINGNADITIGGGVHSYFPACCGASKKSKCYWKSTESIRYSGTCGKANGGKWKGMYLSFWNHNLITDLVVNLLFMDANGIPLPYGPA